LRIYRDLQGYTGVINQTSKHNVFPWLQLGSQQNIIRTKKHALSSIIIKRDLEM